MSRELIDSGIEWIGKYPSNWSLERLQWHLEEIKESNNPIKTTNVLSLTNKLGVIPYEEKGEQGNRSKENLEEYKLAYSNTIVANSMNILIGSVGLSRYYGCVSPVYYVFKAKERNNIEFINYLFQTQQFQKELRRYANGILEIRLRVSSDKILKCYVPFPNVEEQNKIVNELNRKIEKIDLLITNQEKQIDRLKDQKKAIISNSVTKGIYKNVIMKESNINWIGCLPKNWNIFPIKTIAKTSSGGTPSSSKIEFYNGNINWACSYDLKENVIEETKMKLTEKGASVIAGELQRPGTILIAMYGGGGTIGNSGRLECFSMTNQAICSIDFNRDLIDPKFAHYYIRFIRPFWMIYAVGTRKDPNISQGIVNKMPFICPPIIEQKQIVSFLDKKCAFIDSLIIIKQKKIEKLQEYKKSLIYEYTTGKKEVSL